MLVAVQWQNKRFVIGINSIHHRLVYFRSFQLVIILCCLFSSCQGYIFIFCVYISFLSMIYKKNVIWQNGNYVGWSASRHCFLANYAICTNTAEVSFASQTFRFDRNSVIVSHRVWCNGYLSTPGSEKTLLFSRQVKHLNTMEHIKVTKMRHFSFIICLFNSWFL